jgi:hypothetical protein
MEETPMVRSLHAADSHEGFTEDELRQIHVENLEVFAEMDLEELLELGEDERVKRMIERITEKLSKGIT